MLKSSIPHFRSADTSKILLRQNSSNLSFWLQFLYLRDTTSVYSVQQMFRIPIDPSWTIVRLLGPLIAVLRKGMLLQT